MRFVHFSDTHLGDHFPASKGQDPEIFRGKDFFKNYFLITDYILKHAKDIDFILHTGDLFDREPSHYIQELTIKPLLEIDNLGIPIFLIKGNHEKTCFPDSFTSRFKNLHVFCQPGARIYRLGKKKVMICGIPYMKDGKTRVNKLFAQAMEQTNWSKKRADFKILMLHQLLHGAKVGPIGYRFGRFPEVLSKDIIPKEFDYVGIGHIHRKQIIRHPKTKKQNIFFPGAQERITFSEIHEKKGFYDITVDDNAIIESTFINLRCRHMFEYKLKLDGKSEEKIKEDAYKLLKRIPRNGYGKIRFEGKVERSLFDSLPLHQFRRKSFKCHFNFKQLRIYKGHTSMFVIKDTDINGDIGIVLDTQLSLSKIKSLPKVPGLYIFRDSKRRVLYVGKGMSIQSAVRAQIKRVPENKHRKELLESTKYIDCIEEKNILSMIFEERKFLRRFRPPFNRKVSSPQGYSYIVTDPSQDLLFLTISDTPPAKGALFLGPLKKEYNLDRVLLTLENLMDLPTCKGYFYESPTLCIKFLTRKCIAPCKSKDRRKKYMKKLNEFFINPSKVLRKLMKETQKNDGDLRYKYLNTLDAMVRELEYLYQLSGVFKAKNFNGPGYYVLTIKDGFILRTEKVVSEEALLKRMDFFNGLLEKVSKNRALTPDEYLNGKMVAELLEKKLIERV
ncbi:metallophosphoesterase [bacterium]|nr:metallophosphoesterase [bacterium]